MIAVRLSLPGTRVGTPMRRVVDYWRRRGASEARIRKLAIENYARVLRQALQAREA